MAENAWLLSLCYDIEIACNLIPYKMWLKWATHKKPFLQHDINMKMLVKLKWSLRWIVTQISNMGK